MKKKTSQIFFNYIQKNESTFFNNSFFLKNGLIIFFAFCISPICILAQNEDALAKQYFEQQEFEKSEVIYRKLYQSNPKKYYTNYFLNLMALRRYPLAKEIATEQLKNTTNPLSFQLDLGYVSMKQKDSASQAKEWNKAIEIAKSDLNLCLQAFEYFKPLRAYSYMKALILRAQEAQKNADFMSNELINLYLEQQEYKKAAMQIIEITNKQNLNFAGFIPYVQAYQQNPDWLFELERAVYGQLSKNPSSDVWNDAAIWLSLQNKNYSEAVDLAISLDKRKKDNGAAVLNIANLSFEDGSYLASEKGYQYLIDKKSQEYFYHQAYYRMLYSQMMQLEKKQLVDSAEVKKLAAAFDKHFLENPKNNQNAETQLLWAKFQMKFLGQIENAIKSLEYIIALPKLDKNIQSLAKLELGDYLLINKDVWEAALLYGQVDKDEKDGPLGELARFKNAKLFYYKGEFELAQELFSILKSATSELLANDALLVSVFIQDNSNDDTLFYAMKNIAISELLIIQKQYNEADKILDSILKNPIYYDLYDDIWMLQAEQKVYFQQYESAANLYDSVFLKFPRSVLADKALFESAVIKEETLNQKDKALEQYTNLLIKYKDSIYASLARKRLRTLRGEKLETP